jgi:hypothetical protein
MKRLTPLSVLGALFLLTSCDDPQENAFKYNRLLGLILLVVVAVVAFTAAAVAVYRKAQQ